MQRRDAVSGFGAFLLVLGLGFDDGGFKATSWGWSAVLLLLGVAAVAASGLAMRPSKLEAAFLGALGGLVAWTLMSAAWSLDLTSTLFDAERVLVYVAATGALLLVARRGSREFVLAGTLAGASVLCLAGLVDVLVGTDAPGAVSADPRSQDRLSEPLGYANAVALLATIATLLALALAVFWRRRDLRAVAAALIPLLLATLYFTYGRGAWVALAVGLLAGFAVSRRRLELAAAALALVPPAAAAVGASAAVDNRTALALILVLCALAAAAVGAALPSIEGRFGRQEAAVLGGIALVSAAAVVFAAGGPVALVRNAYHSFTDPTSATQGGPSRLLTLSGSSRIDYWRVARQDAEEHPALGSGSGSYGRYWLRNRTVPQPARDAHSLYLETLAELGPVGLLLLLAVAGLPLAAAVMTRGDPLTTAAVAPYVAYLAHAAQDWDWEVPAVTVTAFACAGALLLGARRAAIPLLGTPRYAWAAAAVVVAGLAGAAYAGNRELALAERGSDVAARRAARLQPWSGEPWRLLGESQLARGDVAAARASFREGLERDADEWELWLDLALATSGRERDEALDRAAELNPLAGEIDELRAAA
jgi:hypothetical protein